MAIYKRLTPEKQKKRDKEMLGLYKQGYSITDLSWKYRMSYRGIQNAIHRNTTKQYRLKRWIEVHRPGYKAPKEIVEAIKKEHYKGHKDYEYVV